MRKEGRKKIMPIFLTLTLLLSVLAIVPQISADPFVFPDGIIWKTTGLTCGEEITYMIKDGSLAPETDYILELENDTDSWIEMENGESTKDGDLYITFNAPGWHNLDPNNAIDPVDTWDLRLVYDENDTLVPGYNASITITKYYSVKMKSGGNWLDFLVYNTSYEPIEIYIYNWTGSKYVIANDRTFDLYLYQPDGSTLLADYTGVTTGIWDLDITDDDLDFRDGAGNLEYYLPLNIYDVDLTNHDGDNDQAIPVLLAVTATYPDDAVWGDAITVTGYVKDGQGKGIGGYGVALYSPKNGSYEQAATAATYSTGRFSMSVETGDDVTEPFHAGTWYIGTWYVGDPARVNETDKFEHPIDATEGFFRYYWFELASDDSADIEIESPDEIIDGFEQTINISAEWNNEPFDNDANDEDAANGPAWVQFTGLKAYYNGIEYDDEDIITFGQTMLTYNNKSSYYIIEDIIFNETGTGTIIVTYPYSNEVLSNDEYNNTDLLANITGTLNFQVGSAADMNMIVYNEPEYVAIDVDGDCWINDTTLWEVEIQVYGDEVSDEMNASIHVTGCGLDFTIDEDDEIDENDYLLDKDEGMYLVMISPKTGGTLTITAANSTKNLSVSKDFKVSGLKGSVKTSIGDDKEISVESTETITATIQGGDYAEVIVSYYDENWDELECALFDVEGDGETQGEGLNGIYEFVVEEEDIEDGIGYLVIVAEAADLWMYEIIEVAPVHDLTIEVTSPINWSNKDFTVGLNHEDWEFKVYDPNGDIMDDIDDFYALLVDEDHDEDHPLQTIDFKERSGSRWIPDDELMPWFGGQLIFTAVNNSGENEHDGNITFNVDYATITYVPGSVTAAIGLENITIEIACVDANGDPLPENTVIYLHLENDTGDLELSDMDVALDEDGMAEFDVICAGDLKTWINGTLDDNDWDEGNLTAGNLTVDWPVFTVDPDTIYINQANMVTVIAFDYLGEPIEGINLTIWSSKTSFGVPDPVETDADGMIVFSIEPQASGKANVTIVRDITYVHGVLSWDINDSIVTDTYITITSLKDLEISVSKSPIYQGETLTVTVMTRGVAVQDVDVKFGTLTGKTDATGKVDFTVPDPGVESATYYIKAEKTGYRTTEIGISVIKKYAISIDTPDEVFAGESFTITVIAKGQPLAGATVTLDGKTTKMSDGDGKVTFTAGAKGATHTIKATYEPYTAGQVTIGPLKEKGTPGFELLTLVIAIGIAFILLRRRKQN